MSSGPHGPIFINIGHTDLKFHMNTLAVHMRRCTRSEVSVIKTVARKTVHTQQSWQHQQQYTTDNSWLCRLFGTCATEPNICLDLFFNYIFFCHTETGKIYCQTGTHFQLETICTKFLKWIWSWKRIGRIHLRLSRTFKTTQVHVLASEIWPKRVTNIYRTWIYLFFFCFFLHK